MSSKCQSEIAKFMQNFMKEKMYRNSEEKKPNIYKSNIRSNQKLATHQTVTVHAIVFNYG